MISPEVLRKYKFFGFLSEEYFDQVAMISEPVRWKAGEKVFELDADANDLFLLEAGELELHYCVVDNLVSDKFKEFYVGNLNPGEPFGFSALFEGLAYNAACQATEDSQGIKIDAKKLLELAGESPALGYALMTEVAKAAFARLDAVQIELVAAR